MDYGSSGNDLINSNDIMPYALLISLKSDIDLYVNEEPTNNNLTSVKIPERAAVLFTGKIQLKIKKIGNLYHAGSEYNASVGPAPRIHVYLDSQDCKHDQLSQCFKTPYTDTSKYPINK